MEATCIKKIMHSTLCMTGVCLRDVSNTQKNIKELTASVLRKKEIQNTQEIKENAF